MLSGTLVKSSSALKAPLSAVNAATAPLSTSNQTTTVVLGRRAQAAARRVVKDPASTFLMMPSS